jgi:hypothetical protein
MHLGSALPLVTPVRVVPTPAKIHLLLPGLPDFSLLNIPKRGGGGNMPNCHDPMAVGNIFQMSMEFTNFFHSKALHNLPNFGFFGLKAYHLATMFAATTGATKRIYR